MKKVFTLLLLIYLSTTINAQTPFTINQLTGKCCGGNNTGMGSSFLTTNAGTLNYITVVNRNTLGTTVASKLYIYEGNGLNSSDLIYEQDFNVYSLSSNKLISVKLNTPLDLEANTTYTFYIVGFALRYGQSNTYANGTLWEEGTQRANYDLDFILHFNTLDPVISLSKSSVNENVPAEHEVGSFTTSNTTNTLTYTLTGGPGSTDNASFTLDGDKLKINNSPDYETKSSYNIRVRAVEESGLAIEQEFTITVNDLNEGPTDINISNSSIEENNTINGIIGTLSATDPESGTLTFSLVSGIADHAAFFISGNTLMIKSVTNYETKNSYAVRIRVTDQGGLYFDKDFTITINNVNENPTDILLSNSVITENNLANAEVGTLTAADPDNGNTFTFSLAANGTDNAAFSIVGDKLKISEVADYETKNSYSVRLRVTDQGGLYFDKDFTITIKKDLTTSITNQSLLRNIQIYPNPARDNVTITLEGPALISIHSITGLLLKEWQHESNVVSIADIPSGMYLIKIARNNEIETRKLTIE
jgi:uncharacterized lipoprotein YbaY